jgi:cation diffusion facilitator family transporter
MTNDAPGYTQSVSPVADSTQVGPAAPAFEAGREQSAARLSLASNLILVVIKLAAGFLSGSVSVLAEGVQSTVDVIASAVILWTVRVAAAPPDRWHPYGHGKFENLASLGQMVLILGSAGYLLWAAGSRWLEPVMPRVDWGIAALLVALVVNALVSERLLRVSRATGSQALEAEALHLRGDMLSCIGVLVGLVLVWATGEPRVDSIVAALVTVLVVASAVRLLRESLRPLLDERLPAPEEGRLRAVLEADSRVLGYHRLRSRRAGSHRLIDLHILLDDRLSFSAAHAISEEVEGALRSALPNTDVIVHAEPFEEEVRHQRERHPDRGEQE